MDKIFPVSQSKTIIEMQKKKEETVSYTFKNCLLQQTSKSHKLLSQVINLNTKNWMRKIAFLF